MEHYFILIKIAFVQLVIIVMQFAIGLLKLPSPQLKKYYVLCELLVTWSSLLHSWVSSTD